MATFSERLPTRDDLIAVFVAVAIPVHVWSLLSVFWMVPAAVIRMDIWEMLGVIAYTQAFALFESVLITLLIIILAFILPGRFLRDDLVVSSAAIMLVVTLWLVATQVRRGLLYEVAWHGLLLLALLIGLWVARTWEPLRKSIPPIASRLSVLAALYIIIDLLSVLIVIYRNLSL